MDLNYPLTRHVYRPISQPAARMLSRTFVTPDQLTWLSTAIGFAGAAAFVVRLYIVGAVLTLVASLVDCIDGDLARLTGRSSPAGAFLDSVLDRWTDATLILALGASDVERLGPPAAIAAAGALITSYTRARAQSLGIDCPDGFGTRDIRLLIIVVAALTGFLFGGLVLLAVLGAVTSAQRMLIALRVLKAREREKEIHR